MDMSVWVSMTDLQKNWDLRNLCQSASKKIIKTYCNTRHPIKDQVKKYKRKMGQWINDNKSVYIFENLAYNLIRYNNLGILKADEFRKNLRISNNQSTKRERHYSLNNENICKRKYGEAV